MPSTYTTIQGDTWDHILFKIFGAGAEKDSDKLLTANPQHLQTLFFSAGVVLNVPEIVTPYKIDSVPPWKR
ncbi:MAG: tail protein X [Desulfotalea sp.]